MGVEGSVAGKTEACVSTVDGAPSISIIDPWTNHNRPTGSVPNNEGWSGEVLGHVKEAEANCLLSKVWYRAQIFPTLTEHERQLLTAISWCGRPSGRLSQSYNDGQRDGIDRCRNQMACPFYYQVSHPRGQEWVAECWVVQRTDFATSYGELPAHRAILRTLEYLWNYLHELAYMEPLTQSERGRRFKQRVSWHFANHYTAVMKAQELRIKQLQPAIDRSLMWGNLRNVILPVGVRSAWYMVIQNILPTNVRLHRIRLTDTDKCT
jgi:hypothetical protein